MLLENKIAVIYGAGGAIGGAVARAFAQEGARVFLTGRNLSKVDAVTKAILAAGGKAESAQVDALDEQAVDRHLQSVIDPGGRVHISFNAIGIPQQGIQGIPLTELSVENFMLPITSYTRAHYLTARAALRRMIAHGSGVILMHTPEPGRLGAPLIGGMGPAWAAIEGLARDLSSEYATHGIRVLCIRSTGIPETATIDVVYGLHAKALGVTPKQFESMLNGMSHTRRHSTLAELTDAAVFLASDMSRGMTGTFTNLTGGRIVE